MAVVDHANRFLRKVPAWTLYILCSLHIAVLFLQGATGSLGVEPINALEHAYGEMGLKLMVATLAVTPLRRHAGVNLVRFRRALGLSAFLYISAHLLVWLLLDVRLLSLIWGDILKRPYISVGMIAFVLMIPLAATSNDRAVRVMSARKWRKLHKLTYVIGVLGALHFLLLAKGFQLEPLAYLAMMTLLLASRWHPRASKGPGSQMRAS